MLYPVPAVMVSCQRPGEKPNIHNGGLDGDGVQLPGHGFRFTETGAVFLWNHPGYGRICHKPYHRAPRQGGGFLRSPFPAGRWTNSRPCA